MEVSFLSAEQPIRKQYALDKKGELVKQNYPFLYQFTSTTETATDLQDFARLLREHGQKGHCLLKGKLNRPLTMESRAGSTSGDDKTDWICLDLDGIENYQSIDLFLADIGASDVSYVLQWSSSMGIENQAGYRCHIFMMLNQFIHPQLLKYWLMSKNLTVPNLKAQLSLTRTANALRWPLDVTTCQNDKLLYIADPLLGKGIKDPYPKGKRIQFHNRKAASLSLPEVFALTREALRELSDKELNSLRTTAGMPARPKTKYKFFGRTECVLKPDTAVITETKTERGYVYFNLNGGDSWGYYHPVDNPKFIHNFKGEPSYKTEELLPEYWAELEERSSDYVANDDGLIYFGFRDFFSANYFNGWYDETSKHLTLARAKSESQLRQFMKQHGQVMGECVPDWNLVWDPNSSTVVDHKGQTLNTYQPSEFFIDPPDKQIPFPTITKVYESLLGNDKDVIDHFLNWLAFVLQYRTVSATAWVWQGVEGTGKGVMFHNIITPLFGKQNVISKRAKELQSEFTSFMENKLVILIDEIESGDSIIKNEIGATLRNLITEPTISIRKMQTDAYPAPNYANIIFTSNKRQAVAIPQSDRRHNVAPYQNSKLVISQKEVEEFIPQELPGFFRFLMDFDVDLVKVRTNLKNAAHATMVELNRTGIDTIADAILTGDMQALWDQLPSNPNALDAIQRVRYEPFRNLMIDIVTNQVPKLSRDEMYVLMNWCLDRIPQAPNKFTQLLKHHNIQLGQIWKDGRNVRGIDISWSFDPKWHKQAMKEINGNKL